jgi:hypothetical protein
LGEKWRHAAEVPFSMRFAMIVMAAACLFGGALLLPSISAPFLKGAEEALLLGTGYAGRVMENLK